jgi:hypothetical protein
MDNSANNNLIQFPRSAIHRENMVSLSKNKESVEATQRELLTQMIDFHAHHLLQIFALDGIDVESEDFDKYFALAIECLRASVFNTLDLDHPLLPFLKDMVDHVDKMKEEEEKTE